MASLDLTGGQLDLLVRAGRDAAFIIPTRDDLSGYEWVGEVRATDGTLIGIIDLDVTAEQVRALVPASVTAVITPRARYEIIVRNGESVTTVLGGTVEKHSPVVVTVP